jgi:hypothetical protein
MKKITGNDAATHLCDFLKVRKLFTLLFITGIFCSLHIASVHSYDRLIIRTDCPICKFISNFSSGESATVQLQLSPDFVQILFSPDNLIRICGIPVMVFSSRAPPFMFFQNSIR